MKSSIKLWLYGFTFLSCILSSQTALSEPDLSLSVHVNGGRPNTGEALFHIPKLPPGIYAVSVVYDEDKSGKLNTGFLGIPTELIGFSNNAIGRFGPPPFKKTSFQVNQDSTISITLGKAKK